MKHFTHEEVALMSCYDISSLPNLICTLQLALPHITDKLSADTTADCIDKLCSMNSQEFAALKVRLVVPELL
ncbi:MAG: transposon-transfer assisting family protein [Angelakisella sp.]